MVNFVKRFAKINRTHIGRASVLCYIVDSFTKGVNCISTPGAFFEAKLRVAARKPCQDRTTTTAMLLLDD